MKSALRKILEATALAALMLAITLPATKQLWAQFVPQGVLIQGATSALKIVPVQVDNSGVVQISPVVTVTAYSVSGVTPIDGATPVTISGVPAVTATVANSTSSLTFSQVSVSSASAVQATNANTGRKLMFLKNQSPDDVYVGTTSPVSATSGFTLNAAEKFQADRNVPTNTFFVLGSSTVAQTVSIGEGQ